MLDLNKKLFGDFQVLHDKYALNEERWQDEFNREGEKILTVVREWENEAPLAKASGIFSARFVGSEIPPKRKILRIHPRTYAQGFLRRRINFAVSPKKQDMEAILLPFQKNSDWS